MREIRKGSTDQSTIIRIVDADTGAPETGVVAATSGLDLKYRREGAAAVDITESDLAALDSAHAEGGMKHIGAGYYRLDLPDAACARGAAAGVHVFGTCTGMVIIGAYHPLFERLRVRIAAHIVTTDGNKFHCLAWLEDEDGRVFALPGGATCAASVVQIFEDTSTPHFEIATGDFGAPNADHEFEVEVPSIDFDNANADILYKIHVTITENGNTWTGHEPVSALPL